MTISMASDGPSTKSLKLDRNPGDFTVNSAPSRTRMTTRPVCWPNIIGRRRRGASRALSVMEGNVARRRNEVRLSKTVRVLIMPEFRDQRSRRQETIDRVDPLRNYFGARAITFRAISGGSRRRLLATTSMPRRPPRVPGGLFAVHVGRLELALDVGGELLYVVLVSAKLVRGHLEHARVDEVGGLRGLDPGRIRFHLARAAGNEVECEGADIGLSVGILHKGRLREAVLDRRQHGGAVVEGNVLDAFIPDCAQSLGRNVRSDVRGSDDAVDLVLLRREKSVDLLVACLLSIGIGNGLEQLHPAIGLIDCLLQRLFAQCGIRVDE